MRYWLNLFSVRTWQDFKENGSNVTAFRANNWARAKPVQLGDVFLCYLIGAKRWIGALKVVGERYFDENQKLFRDDVYPVRFQVEPLVELNPEHGLPMELLRGTVSFFPQDGSSKDWSGSVRSSPTKLSDEDGAQIRRALEEAARNPLTRPIDPKVLRMPRPKNQSARRSSGAVSEGPQDLETDATPGASGLSGEDSASDPAGMATANEGSPDGMDEGDSEVQGNEGVSIEKADRSLAELYRWHKNGRLIIDPEWQRSYVWDNKRASKLIESFLMDIPIPVVYLAKTDEGRYEVIDGVQRLTSVFNFFDGHLTLTGMEFLRDVTKKSFKDLDDVLQAKLEDSTIRTFELSPRTSKNLLFIIFERLNTGGIALNEMEIRNCIYRGPLNNLIKELARYPAFVECVDQANITKRMYDRNLVLRFLAFYEKTHRKAQSGLKDFLNGFLQDYYKEPAERKLADWRSRFEVAMRASRTVFGQNGFRLWLVDRKGNGQWTRNVNAAIFQCIAVSFADHDLVKLTRCSDAILEEYLDLVTSDPQWVDSVSKSTGDFHRINYVFDTWGSRLAALLDSVEGLDAERIFSGRLKKEVFLQNKTCQLCGQEIKLIQDAALDHDVHYWRGGKTVPSNARIAHRICNLKRPN
ncbi:MAG: DUF262 domain-containing protein [Isosphaeraceae bacterium]